MSREEFLQAPVKRRYRDVEIAGKRWRLQSLNDWEFQKLGGKDVGEASVSIILLMCVDGDGNPLFVEEDRERWHQQDSALVQELAGACLEHLNAGVIESVKND